MWFTTEEVLLEPDFEIYTVDEGALNCAWAQLCEVSIEISTAQYPCLLQFASDHCLYVAAIQRWVTEKWQDVAGELHINLHTSAQNTTGSPCSPFHTLQTNMPGPSDKYSARRLNQTPLALTEADTAQSSDTQRTYPQQTIGLIYICSGSMPNELTVGLTLLPAFRHRGYASQALTLALRWAFDHLQCHRVQALIMAREDAADAEALFARHGFVHEGTLRNAALAGDIWYDVNCVALLDTEWCLGVGKNETQSRWDVLLARHQREVDRLLEWEAKIEAERPSEDESDGEREKERNGKGKSKKLKRSASMDTVREVPSPYPPSESDQDDESTWGSAAPSPPSTSPRRNNIPWVGIDDVAETQAFGEELSLALSASVPASRISYPVSSTDSPPDPLASSLSSLTRDALADLAAASEQPYRSSDEDSDWERASAVSHPQSSAFSSGADSEREGSPSESLLSWSDLETSSIGSTSGLVRRLDEAHVGPESKTQRRV